MPILYRSFSFTPFCSYILRTFCIQEWFIMAYRLLCIDLTYNCTLIFAIFPEKQTKGLATLNTLINKQGGLLLRITLKWACLFIREFRVDIWIEHSPIGPDQRLLSGFFPIQTSFLYFCEPSITNDISRLFTTMHNNFITQLTLSKGSSPISYYLFIWKIAQTMFKLHAVAKGFLFPILQVLL